MKDVRRILVEMDEAMFKEMTGKPMTGMSAFYCYSLGLCNSYWNWLLAQIGVCELDQFLDAFEIEHGPIVPAYGYCMALSPEEFESIKLGESGL